MTKDEFKNLKRGDIIRHKESADSIVIDAKINESRYLAVRIFTVTNSDEWDKVK